MKRKSVAVSMFWVMILSLSFTGLALNSCSKGKTTLENLLAAYGGESNANARYQAFAKKAEEEGYVKAAGLFKAAARAEKIHSEHHAEVIKKLGGTAKADIAVPVVKSTKENLEEAMKGERYETDVMYPEFKKKADSDKISEASQDFEEAMKAEAVHATWYKNALEDLDSWKGGSNEFYVCPVCGNILDSNSGGSCSICGIPVDRFIQVH